MSLETPSDTTSSLNSDDLSEEIFYYLEDEQFRPETPLPTFDSPFGDAGFVSPLANRMPPFLLTPPPDSPRRPDTSNSSIFSFDTEPVETQISSERLRLPTFIVPENPGFFDSQNASETNLYAQFHKWIQDCAPSNGSFEAAAAEEAEKNPRETRSEPDLPSLFKRRDHGCGYCRSIGYPRWETHTRKRCDQLKALAPCKICGASGEMNHTETYCPMKPPVLLPLTKRYLESSKTGDYNRSCEHFYKYSSLIRRIYSSSDVFF
ncbi:unnamed protein product [Caenorhabditis nigoni]|uniref:Nanos-type domain-containing protein n=1 Tax=Caenorhabditis nigoni TaxID=1611254 RepID=A0A2G5V047_9PELO|nr:hypothetical protein B9Z55_005259 [Caenorhabditis nigoni]